MLRIITGAALTLAVAGAWMAPSPASAANATAPYSNINKANDAGNNTGDSQVDKLNEAQLNANYKGQNPAPAGTAQTGTMSPPPSR